eukprot:Lankesteria_metandrocarpae@DN4499_c0_g1_i1.p1
MDDSIFGEKSFLRAANEEHAYRRVTCSSWTSPCLDSSEDGEDATTHCGCAYNGILNTEESVDTDIRLLDNCNIVSSAVSKYHRAEDKHIQTCDGKSSDSDVSLYRSWEYNTGTLRREWNLDKRLFDRHTSVGVMDCSFDGTTGHYDTTGNTHHTGNSDTCYLDYNDSYRIQEERQRRGNYSASVSVSGDYRRYMLPDKLVIQNPTDIHFEEQELHAMSHPLAKEDIEYNDSDQENRLPPPTLPSSTPNIIISPVASVYSSASTATVRTRRHSQGKHSEHYSALYNNDSSDNNKNNKNKISKHRTSNRDPAWQKVHSYDPLESPGGSMRSHPGRHLKHTRRFASVDEKRSDRKGQLLLPPMGRVNTSRRFDSSTLKGTVGRRTEGKLYGRIPDITSMSGDDYAMRKKYGRRGFADAAAVMDLDAVVDDENIVRGTDESDTVGHTVRDARRPSVSSPRIGSVHLRHLHNLEVEQDGSSGDDQAPQGIVYGLILCKVFTIAAVCAFIWFGYTHANLVKMKIALFLSWVQDMEGWSAFIYFIFFSVTTAFFFPMEVLILSAGFIFCSPNSFGFKLGFPVALGVCFLGQLGSATISITVARYILKRPLQVFFRRYRLYTASMEAVKDGGAAFVFLCRLSPVIPFAVSNFCFGCTDISYWSVFLGNIGTIPVVSTFLWIGSEVSDVSALFQSGHAFAPDAIHICLVVVGVCFAIVAGVYVAWLTKMKLAELEERQCSDDIHQPILHDSDVQLSRSLHSNIPPQMAQSA